jgi:hypothetical protein
VTGFDWVSTTFHSVIQIALPVGSLCATLVRKSSSWRIMAETKASALAGDARGVRPSTAK